MESLFEAQLVGALKDYLHIPEDTRNRKEARYLQQLCEWLQDRRRLRLAGISLTFTQAISEYTGLPMGSLELADYCWELRRRLLRLAR